MFAAVKFGVGTGWTVFLEKKGKLFLNSTRCRKGFFFNKTTRNFFFILHVIMFYYINLSAWIKNFFFIHQRLIFIHNKYRFVLLKTNKRGNFINKKDINFWFHNWFIGYTEGDGCFNIYLNKCSNKINFTFKISQKSNNIQVLYYFKNKLNCGKVRSSKDGMSHFLIRNKVHIKKYLFPIFCNYSFLTCKEYSFLVFKESLWISDDFSLTQQEKIKKIEELKRRNIPENYLASCWPDKFIDNFDYNNIMLKPWIVGFIEAEGSFYITRKDERRYVHGFGLTQKKDKIILDVLKRLLKIKSHVKLNVNGFYSLDALDKKSLKFIKDFFFKTMKSRKSLQYRIWARSFRYKQNYEKLKNIQKLMRKLQ